MRDPIEKLRECLLCKHGDGQVSFSSESANALADEIEAAYMKLPVDADGVPIRPGDYMALGDSRGEVLALTYAREDQMPWQMQLDDDEWYSTEFAHHAKPDTVESLLQELADEVWEASCACQTTWGDSGLDGITERYAERIRKAVEHE